MKNKHSPLITVLLPVWNGEKFIAEAVSSILGQTFINFELLLIDDGSTDRTAEEINKFSHDERIRVITHEHNAGLISTLNEGITVSRGRYIVRMDADDIADLHRMQIQFDYMEANPDISLAGSWYKEIGTNRIRKVPLAHNDIRAAMIFNTAVIHPSVIMRKDQFIEQNLLFDPVFRHAEDYELWVRSSRTLRVANIPQPLISYRLHNNQVSVKENSTQRSSMQLCRKIQLESLGISANDEQLELHRKISDHDFILSNEFASASLEWLLYIFAQNKITKQYNPEALARVLHLKWLNIAGHLIKNKVRLTVNTKNNFSVNKLFFLKDLFYITGKKYYYQFK